MAGLLRDLRFAWRSLLARPAMTAVAAGTLAIGIGLNVTIIAMLNPMLIRPLPFAAPERIAGARITPELWSLLGVRPILGRDLTAADAAPGAPPVMQISYALWQRTFGGVGDVRQPFDLTGTDDRPPWQLYGVVAFTVTLRTREIGVRVAVGATRRDVLMLVLREGLALAAAGAALGLAGALLVGRALARLLYGVAPEDPLTLAVTFTALALAALLACVLPARRAMGVNPATTLRFERWRFRYDPMRQRLTSTQNRLDVVSSAMENGIMEREIAIDSSGRVVIPKDVRRRHRLSAGTRMELLEEGDRLVLVPQQTQTSAVERAGILVFCGRLRDEVPDHRRLREERLDRMAGSP